MEHSTIPIPPDPALLTSIPAAMLADTIERLIEALDQRAGDADLEPNGDEEDFGVTDFSSNDPGYRLAMYRDADEALRGMEDDEDDDPPEEDDPPGGNITDEPHDAEEDRCEAGDDMVLSGPVIDARRWFLHASRHGDQIGSEDDIEPNGDLELNGDEGDYSR